MQTEGRLGWAEAREGQPLPLMYRWDLAWFVVSVAIVLLALVDFRRGFLLGEYPFRTPYFVLSPLHLLMLAAGVAGAVVAHRRLRLHEARLGPASVERHVKWLAFALLALLIADLCLYRGVAAARIALAGKLGAGWMAAFGVTGWLRPLALGVSYLLTVWHATLLGVLLAGLSLTVLPRYLKPLLVRTGLGGSVFGALFALPQPFCSCCASVISPSLVRRGASHYFTLAFVVGSPMLNVTAMILAALLLPAPYAITRILAGIVLTIPLTYAVAWVADHWGAGATTDQGRLTRWANLWAGKYCRLFHLEEMVEQHRMDSPASFLSSWLRASLRIGLLLVPTLFILSVVTAAIVQALPSAFGNNLPSVLLSAGVGTLLMISTWTEIPVAQQMLNAGFSGPAATLLVVLPPVSLPCLMMLGGAIGRLRVAALLALAVALAGALAGTIFLGLVA